MNPPTRKTVRKTAKPASAKSTSARFTADERAAMKERTKELKAGAGRADAEAEVLAKIAAMPEPDRGLATRIHGLVKAHAPSLSSRTWYGMPAWANADGKIVCFFQGASKFKTRYATLGFAAAARLDDGALWPVAFALLALGAAEEKRIATLLKRAVG